MKNGWFLDGKKVEQIIVMTDERELVALISNDEEMIVKNRYQVEIEVTE